MRSWSGRRRMLGILLVAVVGVVLGCRARKSDVAGVTGRVTLDGQPVQGATVGFQPRTGRAAYGGTDADGRYRLFYDFRSAGAVVGTCDVTITTAHEDEDGNRKPEVIPKKYFKPGALVVEVEPKANVFDFELTSSP
jgi:hypothetical protein